MGRKPSRPESDTCRIQDTATVQRVRRAWRRFQRNEDIRSRAQERAPELLRELLRAIDADWRASGEARGYAKRLAGIVGQSSDTAEQYLSAVRFAREAGLLDWKSWRAAERKYPLEAQDVDAGHIRRPDLPLVSEPEDLEDFPLPTYRQLGTAGQFLTSESMDARELFAPRLIRMVRRQGRLPPVHYMRRLLSHATSGMICMHVDLGHYEPGDVVGPLHEFLSKLRRKEGSLIPDDPLERLRDEDGQLRTHALMRITFGGSLENVPDTEPQGRPPEPRPKRAMKGTEKTPDQPSGPEPKSLEILKRKRGG